MLVVLKVRHHHHFHQTSDARGNSPFNPSVGSLPGKAVWIDRGGPGGPERPVREYVLCTVPTGIRRLRRTNSCILYGFSLLDHVCKLHESSENKNKFNANCTTFSLDQRKKLGLRGNLPSLHPILYAILNYLSTRSQQ